MDYVITQPNQPDVDINSQEDANDYNFRISRLEVSEFSLEVNNVLAAKHNLQIVL